MTTTTKTETPTAAMLSRLEAADLHVDAFGNGTELLSWLEASRVGGAFELPQEILDVAAMGLHLAALNKAHVKPLDHHVTDVDRLLAGASTGDILDADDQAAHTRNHWERGSSLLVAAQGKLASDAAGVFIPNRDDLITGPLRQAVADLLKQAKSQAKTLQAFAPDFGPALLADGSPAEMQAYRASRRLQADFETLTKAWRVSWARATIKGGTVEMQFHPARPGGYFAWTVPDDVHDERLRLGHDVEILRIAASPVEYRLLAPAELAPLIAQLEATLPAERKPAWQLVRRGVCGSGA